MKCWISIVSSCNLSCDFFCSRWAFFPINLVELLALSWPFYNSKSSKSNGFASLFRRKRKRFLFTLKTLIKTSYLAQWLDLPLATLFLKIFLLAAKKSLLALSPLKIITLSPCHMSPLMFLLLWLSLLCPLYHNI